MRFGLTYYGFFMVWSRVGWGIRSRSMMDRGMMDRDRESMGGSMVWSSMKSSMVWSSMVYSMVYRGSMKGSMVYRGCMMERGSMVYKWCSVVHRGSVKGVGMRSKGVGGNSDVAFGTKGFMGVLVG